MYGFMVFNVLLQKLYGHTIHNQKTKQSVLHNGSSFTELFHFMILSIFEQIILRWFIFG